MKILVLHTLYSPHVGGGAEAVVKQLAEGLQRRGHEVVVLATGPREGVNGEQVDGLRVYRAGLHNLYWHHTQRRPQPLMRLGWHWRDRYNRDMRVPLRQVIEVEQPDLVLCHNLTGWSISAWDEIHQAGLPAVQVLHDLYLLCPRDTMYHKGKDCARQCGLCAALRHRHAAASAKVTAVIGVSRYLLERVCEQGFFPGVPRHVVYNRCAVPVAGRLSRPDGPLRFGYIGTLSENKGVAWLIQQFEALGLDATLDIAGRGKHDDEARLAALVTSDRVRFVGFQDAARFLGGLDVLVMPSRWAEPFGLVAVEGCAHGLPVIASAVGGLPETIQHGVNGLLCTPENPDSLGQALATLYHDQALRERLAHQARLTITPLLDMERMLDEYETILHESLESSRSGQEQTHDQRVLA
ncbi:glycosyltransferase family 4 protein [Stutzerimonas tarimensis]|uniref:Glycosyltransferase family 4 protein n=1 Tax=Stutzerimonas tarimensis TaxID=1507735 RepID=A0ABV7T367_9GAMM